MTEKGVKQTSVGKNDVFSKFGNSYSNNKFSLINIKIIRSALQTRFITVISIAEKRKRKRSYSFLAQKPLHHQKTLKSKVTTQKRHQSEEKEETTQIYSP